MNYRLNDGTVRCGSHLDASTYQGSTSDPCLYCGVTPVNADDMARLEAHSLLPSVAKRHAEMIEQELRANNLKALVYVFRPAVNVEHLPEADEPVYVRHAPIRPQDHFGHTDPSCNCA